MVTLSNEIWLKVGGAFLQGGKKFAAQISLLLNCNIFLSFYRNIVYKNIVCE